MILSVDFFTIVINSGDDKRWFILHFLMYMTELLVEDMSVISIFYNECFKMYILPRNLHYEGIVFQTCGLVFCPGSRAWYSVWTCQSGCSGRDIMAMECRVVVLPAIGLTWVVYSGSITYHVGKRVYHRYYYIPSCQAHNTTCQLTEFGTDSRLKIFVAAHDMKEKFQVSSGLSNS